MRSLFWLLAVFAAPSTTSDSDTTPDGFSENEPFCQAVVTVAASAGWIETFDIETGGTRVVSRREFARMPERISRLCAPRAPTSSDLEPKALVPFPPSASAGVGRSMSDGVVGLGPLALVLAKCRR